MWFGIGDAVKTVRNEANKKGFCNCAGKLI